jgi:hypothetical protein
MRNRAAAVRSTSSLVRYPGVIDTPTFNIVVKKLKVFLAL